MITLSSKNVKSLDEINKFIMKEYGFDESYVVTNRDLDENIGVFSLHIGAETAVKTYFKKCIHRFPEELQNATVFAPTLKEAIKDKCKDIEINTNFDIVMQNDKDKKYIVGHKLNPSKINKSIEDVLLLIYDYFDPSSDMEASISCGKEGITRLMNYEVVTLRPEDSEDIKEDGNQVSSSIKVCSLNCLDMIGNPYKFNAFTEQSKIFDLTIMKDIKKLDIYLYQNNDFYTSDGTHFRWQDDENTAVTDNIFVSDIQIYLGFPENDFNGDSLTLTTSSSLAYSIFSNNPKTINIKWIHQIDDKNYTIITKENSSEYNINQIIWFRYELDQVASNSYSDITGPNWSVIPEAVGLLQYDFKPEPKKAVEKVKVLCSIITETGLIQNVLSNVLIFENEKSIVDQTTYNATLGLTINCEDDSGGNYFIYNSNGELINEGQGQGYIRTLVPCYQGIPLSNLQDDNIKEYRDGVQSIEWHIPKKNSMIVLTEEDIEDRNIELDTNDYYVIKRERNDSGYINVNQSYSIKNYWHISNANNIIKCYIKNFAGIIFETTIELKFGKAGSNNSNITIILEFLNNNNALKIDQMEGVAIEAIAYDLSGKRITLDNNSETVIKWHWLGQEDLTSPIISANIDNENPARINLTLKKNYDIVEQLKKNYHILQFEYSPTDSPKITTYLPIPIKDSSIAYMEGARKVIYNPYGIPNYYTDAYVIYKSVGGTYTEETATWTLNSKNDYGNLKLKTIKKVKNGQSNSYYALQASTPYIKDDDLYCIVATQIINSQERILWSQPILIIQSQYDAAIINDWDGDSIQLNENSGTIISSMLGAGTKDEDGYVIRGVPNFLSSTTLRPFGPSVHLTTFAILFTPASNFSLEFSPSIHFFIFFLLICWQWAMETLMPQTLDHVTAQPMQQLL